MESLSKALTKTTRSQSGKSWCSLRIGTAIAAEAMGACIFMGILDLVLHNSLSVRNTGLYVDATVVNYKLVFPSERGEIEKFSG